MKLLKDILDSTIRDLVISLRAYGFNTICSCGHLPISYIQMECYRDEDITNLYNILVEKRYRNFEIEFCWDGRTGSRRLEIRFSDMKVVG